MSNTRTISQLLLDFQATLGGEPIAVSGILEAFHERGFGVLLLIFALPMALPLPVPPGVNILLASPLLFLTAQQALGRHSVWFPQWLRTKSLKAETLNGFFDATIPFLTKLEFLTKPRLVFLTTPLAQKITGVLGFIMALSVCVPLPLTNTAPSFGIAVMALGVLMRDGLAVLGGAVAGTAWVVILFGSLIIFGPEGIDIVKDTITSWL